jgi:hypothetical protein
LLSPEWEALLLFPVAAAITVGCRVIVLLLLFRVAAAITVRCGVIVLLLLFQAAAAITVGRLVARQLARQYFVSATGEDMFPLN